MLTLLTMLAILTRCSSCHAYHAFLPRYTYQVLELLGSLHRTTWSKEELWPTPHVTPALRVGGGKAASVRVTELRLSGPGVSVDAAAPVLSWWEAQSRRMEAPCLPLRP